MFQSKDVKNLRRLIKQLQSFNQELKN